MTASYLRNSAIHYLSSRAASRAMLEQTLQRRARKRLGANQLSDEARALIDTAVADMLALGLLDDAAFGATRAASLARKGLPKRRIAAGLRQKGLAAELIEEALPPDLDELAQARRYAERKRLGPWRRAEPTCETRDKDLRALARAGFAYAVAAKALASPDPEPD